MTNHPALPGRLAPADLADREASWPVARTESFYESSYVSLRRDTIVGPDGAEHPRAIVQPAGAVAVLALDPDDRVLLVDQYRHAVGRRMVELPAGILDVAGESEQQTAARELAEEADLRADTWSVLLLTRSSPGYSTEAISIFRATDLSPVPHEERTQREAEEADMSQWWMPLQDAVDAVLAGRISNGLAVAGILAEHARRRR